MKRIGIVAVILVCCASSASQAFFDNTWSYPPAPADHVELLKNTRPSKDQSVVLPLIARVGAAVRAADVKQLEALSSAALRANQVSPSGRPMIAWYHDVMREALTVSDGSNQAAWEKLREVTEKWEAAFPQSPTAKLATTQLMFRYAWAVRGSGYSNTVSDNAMEVFMVANKTILGRLFDIRDIASQDPDWYRQVVSTYKNLSVDLAKTTEVTDQALKRFPEQYPVPAHASVAYLPKWGGSNEIFARFVDHVRVTVPKELGTEIYARIYAGSACCEYFDGAIFTRAGANWDYLKQGLEQIRRKYPDPDNEDEEAYFACSALDVDVLPELMRKIGDAPNPGIWQMAGFFRNCQEIADRMRAHPEGPRSAWMPSSMTEARH